MTGVFNSKPPQPRYVFIWDVQIVLNYIKSNWANSSDLSDRNLTLKLTSLLALTSASRTVSIHHLDVRFMIVTDRVAAKFTFHKLHKSWKKGRAPPILTFYAFPDDPQLCVISTLKEYLIRTKSRRVDSTGNIKKTQLLLGHISPYVEVQSCTISRWLKETLKVAGIDVDTFKGHSTRSASSSKAGVSGLSISDILKRGSWSSESTWQQFYNKPVLSAEEEFQSKVLK